jgi:protein SCO1/2
LKTNQLPRELENIGPIDTTGFSVDLNLRFIDSSGAEIPLASFFQKGKPVLLSPVYYKCPSLCNYHMNGILEAMKNLDWTVGKEFEYVAISINPKEESRIASEKKSSYLREYGREGAEAGYHLLTTPNEATIHAITDQLGFRYSWDESSQQYIHASVAYILTPEGKISRILQGISFPPRDLKLALLEASDGKLATFTDQIALFCFQFDPSKNTYTLYAYNLMRIGGILTVLAVGIFLFLFWKKNPMQNDQGVTQ